MTTLPAQLVIYLTVIFHSCADIKEILGVEEDGHYCLDIESDDGNDVSYTSVEIYCHNMNTSNPKEFITLPAGPDENFSKTSHPGYFAGDMYFNKVAYDVAMNEIIAEDYTFARIENGYNQIIGHGSPAYGVTFSCNLCRNVESSKMKVNLTGTPFHLPIDMVYVTNGGGACEKELDILSSRQYVYAHCDGSCGGCLPDQMFSYSLHRLENPRMSVDVASSLYSFECKNPGNLSKRFKIKTW